jgi:hypothetical protein
MGEVYRARDTRLGRDVALKVISDGAALDHERLQRFEQEARLAGSLNHPNLVVVHDVGSEGGAPFLVTELLEGESLRHRLARGRLPLRTALELGAQIAEGLAAAHARAIVHRDVKPEEHLPDLGWASQAARLRHRQADCAPAVEAAANHRFSGRPMDRCCRSGPDTDHLSVKPGAPVRISNVDVELSPSPAGWTNTGELWVVLLGATPRVSSGSNSRREDHALD